MKLKEYLFHNEIKYNTFASLINVSYRYLWSILKRDCDMKLSVALRIEDATNGEVTCRELISTEFLESIQPKSKPKQDEKGKKKKKVNETLK